MNTSLLPQPVNTKVNSYLNVFHQMYPDKSITDKTYDVTLVRYLMIYFLYQEKRIYNNRSINYNLISNYFGLKTHATAVKAVNDVQDYLDQKTLGKSLETKEIFSHFYYRFQMIFNNKFQSNT